MRDFTKQGRSVLLGEHGMICTSHPASSAAGIEMLRSGGNAVDAALCAIAVQAVVEPHMTGIGGDCFALLSMGGSPPVALDGSGRAPGAAKAEWYVDRGIAQALNIMPDLITCAKGMSNGAVPMGGVLVHHHVYHAMSQGPEATVEFAHGYTYSGHPLACAAALATLDVYQAEGIFEKVARIASKWEAAIHDIRSAGGIVRDIRNLGLLGAVEIEAATDAPGQRARAVANHCLQNGVFVRALGDTLILSPPLIIEEGQIGQIAESIKKGV